MSSLEQAISDLAPQLQMRADRAEAERSISPESIANLKAVGLFRAFVPRTYGGDERMLSEVLNATTDLAIACTSTAWVSTLFAVHNIAVCWLDKRGQDQIFGEGPDVLVASSVAPKGRLVRADGGFRLSGKWAFCSGVEHASWVMLGANIQSQRTNASIEYYLAFVPTSDIAVVDDWHVSGLRATGSKSVEVRDIFVPSQNALLLRTVQDGTAPGLSVNTRPFYRLPWYPLLVSAFPPAALGACIAMLESFRSQSASRFGSFSGKPFHSNGASAMRVAEAAALIDAARLIFRRDVGMLDDFALARRPLRQGDAERIAYDSPFVIDACSRAAVRLFRGSGGRALYETNPIQRYFRDIHAITQHAAADVDYASDIYGRMLLQNSQVLLGARVV